MTLDVTRWLNEIKVLQQQLAETQQERDAALESASHWRQLYNTEGEQRRAEVKQAQETVATLIAKIEKLQSYTFSEQEAAELKVSFQEEISQFDTLEALQARLIEVMLERDQAYAEISRLTAALEQEQEEHILTRKSLTAALGDTVDLLTKAQGGKGIVPENMLNSLNHLGMTATPSPSPIRTQSVAKLPGSQQNPLPKLPQWQDPE